MTIRALPETCQSPPKSDEKTKDSEHMQMTKLQTPLEGNHLYKEMKESRVINEQILQKQKWL